MYNLKMGDKFYDEMNDRYLTVDSIDTGSKTAMCVVTEHEDVDGDCSDVYAFYAVTGRQLFNISELRHFKEV